jgi:hypothetical protein
MRCKAPGVSESETDCLNQKIPKRQSPRASLRVGFKWIESRHPVGIAPEFTVIMLANRPVGIGLPS